MRLAIDLIIIIAILADQVIIDIIINLAITKTMTMSMTSNMAIITIHITTCAIVMQDIMKFQDNHNA